MASNYASKMLIASNIYITTSSQSYLRRLIGKLSEKTQSVRRLPVFCDTTYNRSSIHLISSSPAELAEIISTAVNSIYDDPPPESTATTTTTTPLVDDGKEKASTPHPTLGIIDHVAILPVPPLEARPLALDVFNHLAIDPAIKIERYGHAVSPFKSLADVRREHGYFVATEPTTPKPILFGIPSDYVSNYNIRIRFQESQEEDFPDDRDGKQLSACRRLSKLIRSRDNKGATTGVEVLTLPYGEGAFELATNLHEGTDSERVLSMVKANLPSGAYVSCAYHIGLETQAKLREYFDNGSVSENGNLFRFPP